MQAAIDKCIYGERNRDYNKGEIDIDATEMNCDEKEFSLEISHREALGMLGLLLHVTDISEIDDIALTIITQRKRTSIKNFFL